MEVTLRGEIERITYFNEENGFTIARVKVEGEKGLVTVLGNIASPMPGEVLDMKGKWVEHNKYGEQFHIESYKTAMPATVYGIVKYLGSGLIKGIRSEMAKRIVAVFKEKTLDIIDNDIEKLKQINGIGEKRINMIKEAWEEQKEIREVMLFLQSHGVSSTYAAKIFKNYGNNSIEIVKENPFRLAYDIFGIGFITADNIAKNLGFAKDSDARIEAGILYVLNKTGEEGHVYYPYHLAIKKCVELLDVEDDIIKKGIERCYQDKRLIIEDIIKDAERYNALYSPALYLCEKNIAARIKAMLEVRSPLPEIDADKALSWIQKKLNIKLAQKQKEAITSAIKNKVMIITGGPGTGKTTIIRGIINIFSNIASNIMLAAPTGRAAKRMNEATGYPASTIHRLLEFSVGKEFRYNSENPLNCDLLILDEASMIDTFLMYNLLKALPLDAILILVGDINQLPSVGPGNILKDIISSNVATTIELKEIFRQAKKSMIVVNAHRVNKGMTPFYSTDKDRADFFFIEREDPEEVLKVIINLASKRITDSFGFDPLEDIQVLTPMHKGTVGAGNLNKELQKVLNPGALEADKGVRIYAVNDKVMQIKNNYDKKVYNGDIGVITDINHEDQELTIKFGERYVEFSFSDLDEVTLAYAITIHKSQGSEYNAVIIPVVTQHYILLQRNLLYTAITRGKKLVVMVGTKKAMSIGIHNNRVTERFTYLKERLSE